MGSLCLPIFHSCLAAYYSSSSARVWRVWLRQEVDNQVSYVLRRRFWLRRARVTDAGNNRHVLKTDALHEPSSKLKVWTFQNVVWAQGEQGPIPKARPASFSNFRVSEACLGQKLQAVQCSYSGWRKISPYLTPGAHSIYVNRIYFLDVSQTFKP